MIHGLEYYTKYSLWPEGAITKLEEIVVGERYYRVWCWDIVNPPRLITITDISWRRIWGVDRGNTGVALQLENYNIPVHHGKKRFLFKNYWLAYALYCRLVMERREKDAKILVS